MSELTSKELSLVAQDRNASMYEVMADNAHNAVIVLNFILDASYAPYCMRCGGLVRMKLAEPFLWTHDACGAVHDERQVLR
jgi:hypothetical protein